MRPDKKHALIRLALLALSAPLLLAPTGDAEAEELTPVADRTPYMYMGLDGGVSIVPEMDVQLFSLDSTLQNDPGGTVGFEIGSQVNEHLRFGLSLHYDRFTTSSVRIQGDPVPAGQSIDMIRPLWNLYYDLPLFDDALRPYVGAGIGAVWAGFDSGDLGWGKTSDWGLAYVVHLGGYFALSDTWLLKAGYRFNGTGSLWNDGRIFVSGNVQAHDFLVGVRRDF